MRDSQAFPVVGRRLESQSPFTRTAGSTRPPLLGSVPRMRRPLLLLVLLLLGACGGGSEPKATATPAATAAAASESEQAAPARLEHEQPCAEVPDARCATLRVPLDHGGATPGTLDLKVATSGPADAPVLVILTGGPGQPARYALPGARRRLESIDATGWRLVALDQRGTGAGALRCPALQREMGASDLTPPTRAAVRACADRIGDKRRYFATTDTVADLDRLRQALGVERIALDGTSYGTYVAERYALDHPDRVSRLVLDSVVPHEGLEMTWAVPMQATARVLGPQAARDLKTVVAREHDGPALLDTITGNMIGTPRLAGIRGALATAARGDAGPLERIVAATQAAEHDYPARALSQGLHASTLCADVPAPWGDASAPLAGRAAKLRRAAAGIDPGPFDRVTAIGNGVAQQCLAWPPTPVRPPDLPADLPDVPTLLLAGTRDLSTPLEWARAELAHAPGGRLLTVAGAGHSVQSQDRPQVQRALAQFLRRP